MQNRGWGRRVHGFARQGRASIPLDFSRLPVNNPAKIFPEAQDHLILSSGRPQWGKPRFPANSLGFCWGFSSVVKWAAGGGEKASSAPAAIDHNVLSSGRHRRPPLMQVL